VLKVLNHGVGDGSHGQTCLKEPLISYLLSHAISCYSLGGSLGSGGSSERSLKLVELRSYATTCNSGACASVVFGIGWTSVGREGVESFKS
jgi:hypothetical protein